MHSALAHPTPAVKQQRWGQVPGNPSVVHRPEPESEVVLGSRAREEGLGAHGFQLAKSLLEKAKMGLSTELAAFYYYDQVKRFK